MKRLMRKDREFIEQHTEKMRVWVFEHFDEEYCGEIAGQIAALCASAAMETLTREFAVDCSGPESA